VEAFRKVGSNTLCWRSTIIPGRKQGAGSICSSHAPGDDHRELLNISSTSQCYYSEMRPHKTRSKSLDNHDGSVVTSSFISSIVP
jgi:hypothetical protein